MAKTKKILECDKKWLNAGHLWNYPIITLSITEIWKTVSRTDILAGKPFYKPLKESIEVKNGFAHLPTKPGLGIDLDWDFIDNTTFKKI